MTATVKTFQAKHRYARLTARKARLIADLIRGHSANEALEYLEFAHQRAAAFYKKVVQSAIANAAQDPDVSEEMLAHQSRKSAVALEKSLGLKAEADACTGDSTGPTTGDLVVEVDVDDLPDDDTYDDNEDLWSDLDPPTDISPF